MMDLRNLLNAVAHGSVVIYDDGSIYMQRAFVADDRIAAQIDDIQRQDLACPSDSRDSFGGQLLALTDAGWMLLDGPEAVQ